MKYPSDDYMLSFLDRDADFMINDRAPCVPRVFFEPETGAFLEVFDDADDHVSAYGVVQKIPSAAAIEIAIPDHGQHHEWFCAWLESRERQDTYFLSIGGWFKEMGTDEDHDSWREFRRERVISYFREHCRRAGLLDREVLSW